MLWGSGHIGFEAFGATAGINIRHESLAMEKLTEASAFFAKSVRISEKEYVGVSLNAGIAYLDGRFRSLTHTIRPSEKMCMRQTHWLASV